MAEQSNQEKSDAEQAFLATDDDTHERQDKKDEEVELKKDNNEGVPTDAGWAWVICICAFLNWVIIIGFNRSLSILFVDFTDEYNESATIISLMFTIHSLSGSIASVLVSNIVMSKFSVRTISATSAFLSAATTVLLSVSPNVVIFLLLFIVKGFMFGSLLVGPMSLIGHYFKKRRALASSVATAGFCVAYITFPPITELLRSQYGMRGCLLVVAAIEAHLIAICMFFRPPDSYRRLHAIRLKRQEAELAKFTPIFKGSINGSNHMKDSSHLTQSEISSHRDKQVKETEDYSTTNATDQTGGLKNRNGHLVSGLQHQTYVDGQHARKDLQSKSPDNDHKMLQNQANNEEAVLDIEDDSFRQRSGSEAKYSSSAVDGKHYLTDDKTSIMSASPPLFSSMKNLDVSSKSRARKTSSDTSNSVKFSSQLSIISVTEMPYVPPADDSDDSDEDVGKKKKSKCSLRKVIDLSLFKIHLFRMITIFVSLASFGNYLYIYMPTIAFHAGLTKPEAATVMTVCGVMDLVTRIITGFLGDFKFVSKSKMVAFSTFVIAVTCHFIRYFNTYDLFFVFSIIVGIFGGFRQNFLNVLLLEYVGVERIAKAHGLCVMVTTLTMSINHPVIGAMVDSTGNFVAPLHYCGAVIFLAVITLLCEPVFRKQDEKRLAKEQEEAEKNQDAEEVKEITTPLKHQS